MTNRATYTPDDNKIRIYLEDSLSKEAWEEFKSAGFAWTMKQDSDLSATWSPAREDLALSLEGVDCLEDDDATLMGLSADRAERFDDYRDRRTCEAVEMAGRYNEASGHQSASRAESGARKSERVRRDALGLWGKASYWQSRVEAVISHALYKERPDVRARRIKKIEAEQRKIQKEFKEKCEIRSTFRRLLSERFDSIGTIADFDWSPSYYVDEIQHALEDESEDLSNDVLKAAFLLHCYSNFVYFSWSNLYKMKKELLVDALRAGRSIDFFRDEALEIFQELRPEAYLSDRRYAHNESRLAYERAMLANEIGETASESETVCPGWLLKDKIIHKINRSKETGLIVSVSVLGKNFSGDLGLKIVKLDGCSSDIFSPPKADTKAKFESEKNLLKELKGPGPAKIINLSFNDAERLQSIWNEQQSARIRSWRPGNNTPEVIEMTQAKYSQLSKGAYAKAETVEVIECGKLRTDGLTYFDACARIRTDGWSVIVLTDKPATKKLPENFMNSTQEADLLHEVKGKIQDLASICSRSFNKFETEDEKILFYKALAVGLAYQQSWSQFGLTQKGQAVACVMEVVEAMSDA